ncbi:hypothetical protein OpiT1DRAFT_00591 [Opitutaceae bacterium TAV1]|nr:hypothetical protein OpiT1DRAFT_00591 [Opitutaceae bacterium TAV1]
MSPSIAQKSAREWFLFTIGVKKAEDIIAWTDSVIIEDDKPDARIIDLSTTSPERTDVFVAELERLKEGGDIWKAIGEGLDDVHDFVVAHPEQAERVAQALDSMASWYSEEMPEEFSFISRFCDAFYLARDGIYGGTDAVLADFISHLSRYKK